MKTIILEPTLLIRCKTQEDFNKLLENGYILKELKQIKYLVKNEILQTD